MKQKVKDYLIENNLTDVNKVVAHIEELKASKGLPIEKKQMMFELIYYVYNDSSSLDSFFAGEALKRSADYKIIGETKFYDPQDVLGNYIKVVRKKEQLDDTKNTIISTQNHTPTNIIRILEAVDLQEINKILEDINKSVDVRLTISDDGVTLSAPKENKNKGMTFLDEAIELSAEKTSIPTDATNVEVFHLDTKDNGDKTAFIGFKISNGNFSFVEVPFTGKKSAERTEKQGVLNNHAKEILKGAGTKDHGEVKPNGTRHKAPVHCGGYDRLIFKDNPHLGTIQERLDLAEKFKKEALDAMYFKNTHFVRQEKQTKHKSRNGESHKEVPLHLSKETLDKQTTESLNRVVNIMTGNNSKRCSPQCFCDGSCKKEIPSLENVYGDLTREPFYNFLGGEKKLYNKPIFTEDTILGKKESKTIEKAPIFTYCKVNKNALEALSLRALYGHNKYFEDDYDWQNFTRVENGDFEYSNAEFRHALEIGGEEDKEQHLVASAWNAVARLEIYLRDKLNKS